MHRVIPFLVLLGLTACATNGTKPQRDIQIQCLPLVSYPANDQTAFANELNSIDGTKYPEIVKFLGDYKALRDADRACKK